MEIMFCRKKTFAGCKLSKNMNIESHQTSMVLMKNTNKLQWKNSTKEKFKTPWLFRYGNCGNGLYKTA